MIVKQTPQPRNGGLGKKIEGQKPGRDRMGWLLDYHAGSRKRRSRSRETMDRRRKELNAQDPKTSHRPVNQLVQLRVVCLAADSTLSARTSSWPGCCCEALVSSAAFALSASRTPGLFCSLLLLPAADSEEDVDDASVFSPPNKYRFSWPKGRCCFSSSFFCFMISPIASFFTISDCSGVAVPAACARFASSSFLSSFSTHRARWRRLYNVKEMME